MRKYYKFGSVVLEKMVFKGLFYFKDVDILLKSGAELFVLFTMYVEGIMRIISVKLFLIWASGSWSSSFHDHQNNEIHFLIELTQVVNSLAH